MAGLFRRIGNSSFAGQNLVLGALVIAGIFLLGIVVITPLDLVSQALFGLLTITALYLLRSNPSRGVTLILIALSITISTRYIWWRLTDTLRFSSTLEAFLGIGLILAELYAWIALLLGYVQTAWPLNRQPTPMPEDSALWPTVDLLIPTYNEPLAVVENTVFGAQAVDYPLDKLRIYILDDGRREEFREFAQALGVGYITRPDNAHAKAGNLNHALTLIDGELLALFDSDHVPNRAFLQLTVGGFIDDPKLALVQTPHHFYSPDPFERNLEGGEGIPNEGLLFYGLIQDGNDLWNASFFCGSCAVIRRAAIDSIGGFATETVTEDAHTALRMHRLGWRSAYLKLPLAAGLATERLAIHVGQRMRWARGMTQIFRVDNPMLGRGLHLGQRICYLNAMLGFFFGIPRFIFLTAPLAYLLFGLNIIAASGLMVIAYALPHLWHSTATNSRLQTRYRHSFWGEIYESVLALYIIKPTVATLINPKRGKFNVTEKGGLLPSDYFDYKIVRPQMLIWVVLIIGIIVGVTRWALTGMPHTEVLLLNTFWALYNLMLVGAAISVAREARQLRASVRHDLVLPAVVHLPNGRTIATQSRNMSTTGGQFTAPRPEGIGPGDDVEIEVLIGDRPAILPGRIVGWDHDQLRVMFTAMTLHQQRDLVRVVLCRADAWLDWEDYSIDSPLRSVRQILRSSGATVRRMLSRRPRVAAAAPPAAAMAATTAPPNFVPPAGAPVPPRRTPVTTGMALALALGAASLLGVGAANAQQLRGAAPTPTPGGSMGAPTGAAAPPPQGSQVPLSAGPNAPQSVTPPGQPGLPGPPGSAAATATAGGTTSQQVLTLQDMGSNSPLRLLGTQGEASLPFTVRRDDVVTDGKVDISLAYSPALIPELSHLTVMLNGEVLGNVPLPKEKANGTTASFAASPVLFQENNRLQFRFIGHYTLGCEDPLHSSLWLVVSNLSTMTMQLQKLTLANELSLLPAPFYDAKDMQPLKLPFVFASHPSAGTLQAAGITASWFGSLAAYKGADFPASFDTVPNVNAVVFATGQEKPSGVTVPDISGPTISVVANPNNAEAKLLLVMGRTPEELAAAAQTLAMGSVALTGQTQVVSAPDIPERQAYDAPHWLPTNRAVKLGELVQPTDLQGSGFVPGLLTVNFRTAPDLYVGGSAGIPLDVRYRYPAGDWLNFRDSRLDVSINNSYVRSLPITSSNDTTVKQMHDIVSPDFIVNEQSVRLPPYYMFGRDQLQFYYDLRPIKRGECLDVLPTNVQEGIDPDSTIDLSKVERYASLPNLEYFVSSGFPFTKFADLSQTAIVLPDQIEPADVQTYLDLMGMMGDSTGFPVTRVRVVNAGNVDQMSDKDLIVLGAVSRQPLLSKWADNMRLHVESGRLRVVTDSAIDRVYTALDPAEKENRDRVDRLLVQQGDNLAAMAGMESPLRGGRSVVFITGSTAANQLTVLNSFRNRDLSGLIQGDFMVASPNPDKPDTPEKVTSFRIGKGYTVGHLSPIVKFRAWLGDSPLMLILVALVAVLIVALILLWILNRIRSRRLARAV